MLLDRVVSILELVAVAGRPISVPELQGATGLPRPTCYRLVQTLQDLRLLEPNGGEGKVVIGERLTRIASMGTPDADVRRAAAPFLRSAAIGLNETVFLSRFRNSQVEIIHVETPDDPARDYVHPGLGVRPMHACSCSKAIAAFAGKDFQDRILAGPLRRYTGLTKTSEAELRAEFDAIARQGYAECGQEIDLGVSSVAAPVVIGTAGAMFSIGAVGPIRRFRDDDRRKIGRTLIDLSEKVGRAIRLCNGADV